jgi:N-carbamoylputrescine amidase
MKNTLPIGLIQMSCSDDPADNLARAIEKIATAADRGAQIICLQELFKSRYFCQAIDSDHFGLAEAIDQDSGTVQRFRELAAELRVVLIVPLFEKRGTGIYHNAAVVIDADGRYLGKYRKMHIPDDPHYCEKYYFTPGDLGYKTFKTKYADIGVLICWDQWFPEAARLTAMKGAQIIFYPTAIGYIPSQKGPDDIAYCEAWKVVQRGHAVANACYIAVVNRVGFEADPSGEDGLEFWGQSFIADPLGKVAASAAEDREAIMLCPVDLSLVERIRTDIAFPFRDRRVDSYSELTELYLE